MISEHSEPINTAAAAEPPVEKHQTQHPFGDQKPEIDEDGNPFFRDTQPDPDPVDPRDRALLDKLDPTRHKRNCGRTGPTTPIGRGISARNATRHGMCAKTLILEGESAEEWNQLLKMWLAKYQNPAADDLLYTFVVKAAQSEWYRLRIQREYDLFYSSMDTAAIWFWQTEKQKQHDLMLRYVNTAEHKVLRETRMLGFQTRTHHPRPISPQPPLSIRRTQEKKSVAAHICSGSGALSNRSANELGGPVPHGRFNLKSNLRTFSLTLRTAS